jgi:hypothetical protein
MMLKYEKLCMLTMHPPLAKLINRNCVISPLGRLLCGKYLLIVNLYQPCFISDNCRLMNVALVCSHGIHRVK